MAVERFAHVFDDRARTFDSLSTWVWDPIGLDAADVLEPRPGDHAVDLCCGTGASAVPIALAVGPDGEVDGIDHAPALLDIARKRAKAAGLDRLRFRDADVTSWRHEGEPYDLLACVLGAFFLPDRDAVLTRIVGESLRPGGRAVFTVWTEQGVQPLGRLLADAVGRCDPARIAPPPQPGARLESEAALSAFGRAVGLESPRVVTRPAVVAVDPARVWAMCTGTGFAGLLDGLTEAQRDDVRGRVDDGMAAHDWQLDLSVRHLVGSR